MADTAGKRIRKKTAPDEVKTSLMDKYREMFVDKLTPEDLEELQFYLRQQYDKERGLEQRIQIKIRI